MFLNVREGAKLVSKKYYILILGRKILNSVSVGEEEINVTFPCNFSVAWLTV